VNWDRGPLIDRVFRHGEDDCFRDFQKVFFIGTHQFLELRLGKHALCSFDTVTPDFGDPVIERTFAGQKRIPMRQRVALNVFSDVPADLRDRHHQRTMDTTPIILELSAANSALPHQQLGYFNHPTAPLIL
jgi:hypothetical protein